MFRFRLDFLLRYRRQLEEAEMYELANKVRGAVQIRDELISVRTRASELVNSARQRRSAKVTAPVLALYSNYLHELRKRDLAGQRRLALAEREVERQRKTLTQASIKRKTIEKLEERERKSYMEANRRRENKILDEIASLKFVRKNDDQ